MEIRQQLGFQKHGFQNGFGSISCNLHHAEQNECSFYLTGLAMKTVHAEAGTIPHSASSKSLGVSV
jgi:hypothetical protein